MPTFKAYKNGAVIEEFSGAVPAKLTVSHLASPLVPPCSENEGPQETFACQCPKMSGKPGTNPAQALYARQIDESQVPSIWACVPSDQTAALRCNSPVLQTYVRAWGSVREGRRTTWTLVLFLVVIRFKHPPLSLSPWVDSTFAFFVIFCLFGR